MVIHVLDREHNLVGVIDDYSSLIWRPSYNEIGDFEIYLKATPQAIAILQKNYYVARDIDVTIDKVYGAVYKKVMIIKNIRLTTDVESGDYLTVTGRELKFLFHQRIVWQQQSHREGLTAELVIRRLMTLNAINPVDSARAIPNMLHADVKGFTETIELQVSNRPLDEVIIEICQTYGYGWDIYIKGKYLVAEVYKGVDRSYNQTDNPYVVFSDFFENLHNTEYVYGSENYANVSLVGGEGEGTDRRYAEVNNDIAGLDRYEIFTDAKSISQNLDDEDEAIGSEEYLLLLEEAGRENLASKTVTESFTGEVISDLSFKYGEDFNLGDIVTVINQYGISQNVRVASAIESVDDTGIKLIPQFQYQEV